MSDRPEGHSAEMSDYIEDLQQQLAELEQEKARMREFMSDGWCKAFDEWNSQRFAPQETP